MLVALTATPMSPAAAQVRFDTPNGRVEVLGLERWTRRMLEDSIAHYKPGETLASAACMAILRYQLNFRDALVSTYRGYDGPNSMREFVSIRLVEPGNRTATRWRTVSTDAFQSVIPEYAPLVVPQTDSAGGFYASWILAPLQLTDSTSRQRMLAHADSATREGYRLVSVFLAAHRREADRRTALRMIDSSSVYTNRIAAALVLSNFAESDASWYALVRALRDPHETVRGAAAIAIRNMPRRAIDWSPAQADLRALLGGTNIGEMEPVMELLADTKISPPLARQLLRNNDVWIMRLLGAQAPMAAYSTRKFLTTINNGNDLGASATKWHAWIASK